MPRATDSQDAVVVSFGQIHGGQNANVIPEQVVFEGTVRTLDRNVREKTIAHIRTLAEGIERVTSTRLDVSFETGIASVYNDEGLTQLVRDVSTALLGPDKVIAMRASQHGQRGFRCLSGTRAWHDVPAGRGRRRWSVAGIAHADV